MRAAIIARSNGCDEVILHEQGRIVKGDIVHHIEPIKDNPIKAYDVDNLIYVSRGTHKMIHDAYDKDRESKEKMQGELRRCVSETRGVSKKVFDG